MFEYKTHGTCSTQIDLEIEDGVITACTIHNGCRGNTAGLAKMVVGRKADDVKEPVSYTHLPAGWAYHSRRKRIRGSSCRKRPR